jgi:hypothetical protein
MSRGEQQAWADWVVATCLRFGASVPTAYQVAAAFVAGLGRPRAVSK